MSEKFYLTKRGLEKIKKEYQDLRRIKLAKTDREDLSFLEDKLAELESILKNAEIIKPPSKERQGIINLGATVVLEDSNGKINEFMIVGTLETNPKEGKISLESPIGKALLNHKVYDEVMITSPIKVIYKIKKIKYQLI
jgi:transcription elongation factor GreA